MSRDPGCEVHQHLMPDGRCTCKVTAIVDHSHNLRYVVYRGEWELKYAKPGDVGLDLPVIIDEDLQIRGVDKSDYDRWVFPNGRDDDPRPCFDIPPNCEAEISTGIKVKVPENTWGNIKSRSSTGWKRGLSIFEGVIDSGYTGPLRILAYNPQPQNVRIYEGDRLAQLILIPAYRCDILRTDELPKTERGETGFGSTGGV